MGALVYLLVLGLLLLSGDPKATEKAPANPAPVAPAPASAPRARVSAAAQRNENVAVYLIDTNAAKEANIRLGTTPTFVAEPSVDTQHYGAEHGRAPAEVLALRPQTVQAAWHGEGFWWHQNSVFNARTFFQVGPVQPSHRNVWGGRASGLVSGFGFLSLNHTQRDIRGMVNGNVLVPLESERTPTTLDPAARAIVQRFLDAYPRALPNRPDFDPRALNTNAPQRIDQWNSSARLDRDITSRHRLLLSWVLDRQRIKAFQFVAGQNPDTDLHSQRARIGWNWTPTARTNVLFTAAYQRNVSLLVSEPNAVGPRVRFGFQIEELGPDSQFPIDRVTNSFRYGAQASRISASGKHEWTFGADLTRFQLNGIESGNLRGYFQFTNNFGRQAIENLLAGTPTTYEIAVGELSRGYRNWTWNAYVADRWKLHPRFRVYLGLRWMADTRPVEIRQREIIPYSTDWNNLSPRVALTWQAAAGWVIRAMYTTAFSQILPVSYQQVRNNPPLVTSIQVNDPDLVDPLRGVNLNDPNRRYSPTWLSPDLVAPYSHYYGTWAERRVFWNALLRLGYTGSRHIKPLNSFIENRAQPVPGIPLTTATVDRRRANPRYFETRSVVNGGRAWFDAGSVSLDLPTWRGLSGSVAYHFSKALDEGADFTATAANRDIIAQRSQSQFDSFPDRKGLSNFDSPHSLLFAYVYDVPVPASWRGLWRQSLHGWQLAGTNMWKTGTPFTFYIGSDAPGFGNVDGSPSDRPHILDSSILGAVASHPNTAPDIFTKNRFAFIRPGELRGNLGRNTFRKASLWNWNAALQKQMRVFREGILLIRAEAYNLSNTPQFDEPQRNLSSPSFGRITNTLNDGRVLQMGLRFLI